MGLLDDKVVIVTGAEAPVGRAVARCLAAEGAQVVLSDPGAGQGESPSPVQELCRQIEADGGRASVHDGAPTTAAGAAELVDAAVSRFGGLDVLVNTLAVPTDGPLLELGEEAWTGVVDSHLKPTFFALQAAARQLVSQGGGGRIVNTTGLAALQGEAGRANLAAAQGGIYGLTRAAAIELQRDRITVNAVAPVVAATEGASRRAELDSLGELTPAHVAPAVLLLASDLCGERTGRVLGVCGSRVYTLALVESRGQAKDGDSPWTAAELSEHWDAIAKR